MEIKPYLCNMKMRVKYSIILLLVMLCCVPALAQNQFNNQNGQNSFINQNGERRDSLIHSDVDAKSVPHEVHAWRIDSRFGQIYETPVDTLFDNFQNSNETWGVNGEYNILGNMGSPRLSRIFMNRKTGSDAFFLDPYDFYLRTPENHQFINTKSPFTVLNYWFSGDQTVGDDRFKAIFSVNANKRLNFGFVFDYLYGRGYYQNQATSFFNGSLFASYTGEKYKLHGLFSTNSMKMSENGGITDDTFITDPIGKGDNLTSNTIPTVLDKTWNVNDNLSFYFNHQYNVGFHRAINDSTREFVPVTSFIHTLEVNTNERKFMSYNTPQNYYQNSYLAVDSTYDKSLYTSIKNTFAIQLKEGFNKWAQAGLTGFITANVRSYQLPTAFANHEYTYEKYNNTILSVGGFLNRTQGKYLNYSALAETWITGDESGDLNIDGTVGLNFKLLGDTINLQGHAFFRTQTPNFFLRHYHSRHYWWDNDLSKETRTRIEGTFQAKRMGTRLRISVENIKNYTYLASLARTDTEEGSTTPKANNLLPQQENSNIQVFSAQLKQDLSYKILHFDNELTFQSTSNEVVLPLPKLNVYSNLYAKFNLVKNVLKMQIGADMRFFTKYYAPDYSPALGQFVQQDQKNLVEIGNYPIITSYVNAEWKRARIYLQVFHHVNEGMGNANAFLVPHYPINPQALMFGLSWNFYD